MTTVNSSENEMTTVECDIFIEGIAIDENDLLEEKAKLYEMLNIGYDCKSTLDAAERTLAQLKGIDLITRWIIADYAYKGIDICNAIEANVRHYAGTCQHYQTHKRIERILQEVFRVSQVYHKANQWRRYDL